MEFMEKRGHAIVPSASLVPENDPTTLFVGSGMQPMVPYLLGEAHPRGNRIANSQKCFRAEDIEEVGDNRHTTFFEMLGNWSFGDYFKKEQIEWIFEFLTGELGLDPEKLYVTVFAGDEKNNLPRDNETARIWKRLFKEKGIEAEEVDILTEENGAKTGMRGGRIFYYNAKNWWSRAGSPDNMPAGEPGGPDSEMFYDFGAEHDKKFGEHCHPNCDCGRFLEIGNSVFMMYKKTGDGVFEELPKKNIDFGGGLERFAAAAAGNPDIFQIDLFTPIIKKIEEISGKKYGENAKAFRVIADHIRAAVFMIADGVLPLNTGGGYVLRRLIRRAVRYGKLLGIGEKNESASSFVPEIAETVIDIYKDQYPELEKNKEKIFRELRKEEEKFGKTLEKGLKALERLISRNKEKGLTLESMSINGVTFFDLFQTYGFPFEMTIEEIKNKGFLVDERGMRRAFNEELSKHQELSKTASAGMFKGGLAGDSEETAKLHTATHLLQAALKEVLGEHVSQRGSNITAERLRFDFSHPEKLTDEQKKKVEDLVNEKIRENLPVVREEMGVEEAKEKGAIGVFGAKYGDKVKVYSIGGFSKEICGGPHVKSTGELGRFKIKKQEASSAGVRRIKAILE